MCGIFGNLRFQPTQSQSDSQFTAALQTLHHRGPDEQGSWQDSHVFLGMCRLSIIDLATGQQPIWNEDHTLGIIYNGELYNFQDLRPQLQAKGHIFRTHSDTEVILHAYEEWGAACLQRLNGMFAFAIWDTQSETLFIARDRIGEKPLYYYHDANRFIFASEIKAIVADESVPRQLNWRGVANFFAFGHAIAPETMYEGIYKLLPAHYMVVQHGRLTTHEYWDVGHEPPEGTLTAADYPAAILTLLDDSVRRRMIADVPVGAFLSGGVDSSAIVALMTRHATGPVKTFSLGFTTGGAYNELSDARRVADFFGTEHHELQIEHFDLVSTLNKLVYHYDEPFGDAASFPVYLLSQFARQHVTVVLTGEGGDELFGGYSRYAMEAYASLYHRLPHLLTHQVVPTLVNLLPRLSGPKRGAQAFAVRDPAARYAFWLQLFSATQLKSLFLPEFTHQLGGYDPTWPYPHYYHKLKHNTANDHLNRLMYTDLKTWLVDTYMEKVDKAMMANSVEGRLPFLDHRLVELAFQIPAQHKIKRFETKLTLKQAVRQLLPPSVLQKPKHGFAVPIDPWFRGHLKEYTFDILLDDRTTQRGYFHKPFVEKLWKEHQDGRHIWAGHLWLLLNFELWHRTYLDK